MAFVVQCPRFTNQQPRCNTLEEHSFMPYSPAMKVSCIGSDLPLHFASIPPGWLIQVSSSDHGTWRIPYPDDVLQSGVPAGNTVS